ncbi:MAG TPA: 50S ribosomal protein L25/general stress protein Ctc [Dehalococcoidales bacterium]|nr:50S ribosomal protein L25/general stress protein Ctc [Dehalococcoidales bacterium]
MKELKLNAARRDVLGKRNRFLRRQGITPAHLFGHSLESQALQCDTVELKKIITRAGETRLISLEVEGDNEPKSVFLREVQRDAFGIQLLHVDFYQVRMEEKMEVDVPIVLVGEAPAMKGKGRMLSHGITELSIECLPAKVPPQIEVDISVLEELEQSIQVKDIILDPDITVHADPEQLVVKVTEVQVVAEEEVVVAEEEGAEVEAEAEAGAKAEGAPEKPSAGAASGKKE